MNDPLRNCTPVYWLEHFNQCRKGKNLTFVRPTGHWMWTYVYVEEIFTQVGLILTWKDRCGSYTYKCTFLGPKHWVTKLITDIIIHFSQQHPNLSQLSFYYILPWESLNLGERSFFGCFWSAVSLQPLLPRVPGKWPKILIWLLFCERYLCITAMWKGYHVNDIMHILITGWGIITLQLWDFNLQNSVWVPQG